MSGAEFFERQVLGEQVLGEHLFAQPPVFGYSLV
jgi:hypothetical protein